MSLPAITDEITEAAADPRRHTSQQRYDWKSRARDLDDACAWLGPQLSAQVDPAASETSKGWVSSRSVATRTSRLTRLKASPRAVWRHRRQTVTTSSGSG